MKPTYIKIILITGASSGIGKACFDYLQDKGHVVYGTSRKKSDITGMLQMDVTNEESIRRVVNRIHKEQGKIDVLINNAGISLVGAIEDTSLEEAQLQLDTNFWGVVRTTNVVLPIMRKQKIGAIINISSIGGLLAIPFQAYYSASKFALEALTESLRMEVKAFGIKACLIEPGDFKTEISQNRLFSTKTSDKSPYHQAYKKAEKVIVDGEANGDNPIKIAVLIARIIHKKNPRVRYTVGKPLNIVAAKLKKVLPQKVFEKLIANHYGI